MDILKILKKKKKSELDILRIFLIRICMECLVSIFFTKR